MSVFQLFVIPALRAIGRSALFVAAAAAVVAAFLVFGCGARVDFSPPARADIDPNGATAYESTVVPCSSATTGPRGSSFVELRLPGRPLPDLARSSALLCYPGQELDGVQCFTVPVGVEDNRLIVACPVPALATGSVRFTVIR